MCWRWTCGPGVGADEVADRAHGPVGVGDEGAFAAAERVLGANTRRIQRVELVVVPVEDVDAGGAAAQDAQLAGQDRSSSCAHQSRPPIGRGPAGWRGQQFLDRLGRGGRAAGVLERSGHAFGA